MSMSHRLLVCASVVSLAMIVGAPAFAVPLTQAVPPDAQTAAKCKAASFKRHPAGQMATTMRDMQIQRCIKNKGAFID
jgi:hypothetical protein